MNLGNWLSWWRKTVVIFQVMRLVPILRNFLDLVGISAAIFKNCPAFFGPSIKGGKPINIALASASSFGFLTSPFSYRPTSDSGFQLPASLHPAPTSTHSLFLLALITKKVDFFQLPLLASGFLRWDYQLPASASKPPVSANFQLPAKFPPMPSMYSFLQRGSSNGKLHWSHPELYT